MDKYVIKSIEAAKILLDELKPFDSALEHRIAEHELYLAKENRGLSQNEALIDFLNYHLNPFLRGYKDGFAKCCPNGEAEVPAYNSLEELAQQGKSVDFSKGCPFFDIANRVVAGAIGEEVDNCRYFSSKRLGRDVGENAAELEFENNFLDKGYPEGMRYFLETRGCPYRKVCFLSKPLAEKCLCVKRD